MKENIKICSCTQIDNDRIHIVGSTETNEIECFYVDKSKIPDCYLVCKGDNLIIEYDKKERGVQTIISVEKWRISNMKERLIKIVDECIAENKRKTEELNRFLGSYELSESGIRKAREKAAEELREFISKKVMELEKIYDQAIEQLDTEEQKEIEKKNNSLEFQQLIREKTEILRKSDITKIESSVLREYIKEFANYPVAIALLINDHPGKEERIKMLDCLPEDIRGERQKRMSNSKNDVIATVKGLVNFDERGNITRISMVERCKDYIHHQTEDFSLSSEVVWNAMKSAKTQTV